MKQGTFRSGKISYIEGMRGIVCLLIMNGHFMGIIKYCTIPISESGLNYVEKSVLGVFINETFWLYCFFVISGYCLSTSYVTKPSSFILKVIKRFFRLVLPIMGACIYIYIIYRIVGFHNDETRTLFINPWYQNSYSGSLLWTDVIFDPIYTVLEGGSKFNSPYWCIHDMFVVSIFIMAFNLLKNYFYSLKYLFSFLIICWCMGENMIYQACICGMLCQWYEKDICKIIRYKWVGRILLGTCAILTLFQVKNDWGMIYFSVLLLTIPQFPAIEKILSSKIFVKLGRISFGIYSFHWPLLCSVGAALLLYWYEFLPADFVLLSVFGLTGITTILLSLLYYVTLERLSYWCIDRICGYINKIFKILSKGYIGQIF